VKRVLYTEPVAAISIRDPEVGEVKRERDKRPLMNRIEELARRLESEAGANPRDVTKEELDALWGH